MVPECLDDAARALLGRLRVAHLATADPSGRPHVVPVCYAFGEDVLWFVVDEKPKRPGRRLERLRNLDVNPQVALVADVWNEDWSRLEFVLIRGRATVVAEIAEWESAVERLRARYEPYRSMLLSPDKNPVVRIDVEHVHHWRAAGPERRA